MKHKKVELSYGKELHIYDDVLPLQMRFDMFAFAQNSLYKLGWKDGKHDSTLKHSYLHSTFSPEDDARAGILPFIAGSEISEHFKHLQHKKSIMNLSVPSDTHFVHSHPERLVVLYYVNVEWHNHWHGETLFFADDLNEIEHAIKYTPGRFVVFDGRTPHTIRPQSTAADSHRFTYAMIFD